MNTGIMQYTTFLFLMSTCLNYLVSAETQSADIVIPKADALLTQTLKQQQQFHQQQQQQRISSHPAHSDQQIAGSERVRNESHYQSIAPNIPYTWLDFDKSPDTVASGISLNMNTDIPFGAINDPQDTAIQYRTNNFKNAVEDFFRTAIKSYWDESPSPYKKYSGKYIFNEDKSQSSQIDTDRRNKQPHDHRVDKREASDSFSADDLAIEPNFADDNYPIFLDRRYQVFRPSNAAFSSPYLSAQEYKETFRRSDPYFMGKRDIDVFSDNDVPLLNDKRPAPQFIGKRDAPYFVGKRASSVINDDVFAQFSSEEDESSLLGDKRAAPKFVGRRGAPYFVGKKAVPMFVGKRVPILQFEDEGTLSADNKRGAPKFIGRRGAPFFVGKRVSSNYDGNSWNEDDLNWLLESKKMVPTFVGRRGAPYFVGKRGPPKFVGKRAATLEDNEDESSLADDNNSLNLDRRGSPYFVGKRGAPMFVGKRGAPMFVGKRRAPMFVGKRLDQSEVQDKTMSFLEAKRRAPKFVGRRGSPYFVGKRKIEDTSGEDESLLEDKRAAPKFVGRRGAPYFVGKRGAPKFIGKRGPPMFIGKRGPPYFVGRRAAPMFVGKRYFDLIADKFRDYAEPYLEASITETHPQLSDSKIEPSSLDLLDSEDLRTSIKQQKIQGSTQIERTNDELSQNDVVEEIEGQR